MKISSPIKTINYVSVIGIFWCKKLICLNFGYMWPTLTEHNWTNVKKLKIAKAVLFFFLVKEVGTGFPLSQLQQTSHWKRVINFLRINVCFALNNIVIQLRNDSFCVCGWGCWNTTYDIPGKKIMNLHRKCFVLCLQKHQDMSAGIIKRLTVYIWTSIRRKESCLPSPRKITYGKARFGTKLAVLVVANTDICPFSSTGEFHFCILCVLRIQLMLSSVHHKHT